MQLVRPAPRVGIVGLGAMGEPMAANLLSAGWEVHGWNRTPERARSLVEVGLRLVGSAREAAEAADLVLVSVFDDAALEAVMRGHDGVIAGCRAGTVVLETSTVLPSTSEGLADEVSERGGSLVRAPVSGNPIVARAAALTFLCSGDRAAYDRCSELFAVLCKTHRYFGPGEEARYAKLALNLMIAGTMQLLAEALTVAEAAGIERAEVLELITVSAIGSPMVGYKSGALVAGDYSPTFPVRGMRKDLALLFRLAGELTLTLPASETVDRLLAECEKRGWGDLDFAALLLRQEAERPEPVS